MAALEWQEGLFVQLVRPCPFRSERTRLSTSQTTDLIPKPGKVSSYLCDGHDEWSWLAVSRGSGSICQSKSCHNRLYQSHFSGNAVSNT